jgi:hypothetical protein
MAKMECFAIAGIETWFFSNDYSPPHFHAKRKGAMGGSGLFSRVLNEQDVPGRVAEGQRNPESEYQAPGGNGGGAPR